MDKARVMAAARTGADRQAEPLSICFAVTNKMAWIEEASTILGDSKPWFIHPAGMMGLVQTNKAGVTPEQLKLIFPQASDEDIHAVVAELEGNLEAYKLDTPFRLRHFFAQIKGEVGPTMKGRTESFQFSPSKLLSFSDYYRAHPDEAEQDGYAKDPRTNRITRRANEQAIGRKHYSRLNGNRSGHPDDGINLRGRGLIQITGYDKYHGLLSDYNDYWSDTPPDFVNQPEKVNEMPYAVRSAIWFWLNHRVYTGDRGNGYADVVLVTAKVNGRDMGLPERQSAYRICEEVFL